VDALGLYAEVFVNGNGVIITFPMEYTGPRVTPDVVDKFNDAIRNIWTNAFGKYNVTAQAIAPSLGCAANKKNTITVGSDAGRSYVNGVGSNTGTWYADALLKMAGLPPTKQGIWLDCLTRYTDNASGVSVPHPGYEQNRMGAFNKPPSEADIEAIIRANNATQPPAPVEERVLL
jgi:hypothetical protein